MVFYRIINKKNKLLLHLFVKLRLITRLYRLESYNDSKRKPQITQITENTPQKIRSTTPISEKSNNNSSSSLIIHQSHKKSDCTNCDAEDDTDTTTDPEMLDTELGVTADSFLHNQQINSSCRGDGSDDHQLIKRNLSGSKNKSSPSEHNEINSSHGLQKSSSFDPNLIDLECQLSGFAQEGVKVMIAFLYCMTGLFVSTLTMVVTAERVPDSTKYPPLPDLILDNLPHISWAFRASEYCIMLQALFVIAVLIFHKYRLIVLRRGLSIAGSIMLLRSLTIVVTSLSVPNQRHNCIPLVLNDGNDENGEKLSNKILTDSAENLANLISNITWRKRLMMAFRTFKAGGLSIAGVETCGDYMFSGHTAILTLLQHVITEYGPKWPWLHASAYILNTFGAFFVLAGHEHYTLDVLMALYITSRMCNHYVQLANTGPVHWRTNQTNFMSFPLFWFLEGNIPGTLPNIYEHPKYIVKRNCHIIKTRLRPLLKYKIVNQVLKKTSVLSYFGGSSSASIASQGSSGNACNKEKSNSKKLK